jgi:hypothetical protein
VWVAVLAVLVAGVGVVVPRWSPWTNPAWWRVGLGVGAVVVGIWAVLACIADIRSGLPGSAIPWLAVGCVALLVAAVLLGVSSPVRRGSVVRQALPAVLTLVMVVASAVAVDVVGWRLPVDATTAEPVDRAGIPDLLRRVRWTSTWPDPDVFMLTGDAHVLVAGTDVIVVSGDRIVALDGSTGAERWHYRRAGARIYGVTASPYGDAVVAYMVAGGGEDSRAELFAFDAGTGEPQWTRPSTSELPEIMATDHVLVESTLDERVFVGVDLGSGEEVWTWTLPPTCERDGAAERSPSMVLVSVICRDPAGHRSYGVIGVNDRFGFEEWRHTGPPVIEKRPGSTLLTASPDRRAAVYTTEANEPVLLRSSTGFRYRAPEDTDIVGFDERGSVVVLRRDRPGTDQLVLHNVSTGAEHSLESTCPALEELDRLDTDATWLDVVVTPSSDRVPGHLLVLCYDGRERANPRVDIDVYSPDGARRTTVNVADEVSAIHGGAASHDWWPTVKLLVRGGAAVLVYEDWRAGRVVLVGVA